MNEKIENTLTVKNSLVYGSKGIARLAKGGLSIQDDKEFNRKVGRALNIKIVEPEFVNESGFNYRLKDFTAGFFEGENKKCMGLQYNYTK